MFRYLTYFKSLPDTKRDDRTSAKSPRSDQLLNVVLTSNTKHSDLQWKWPAFQDFGFEPDMDIDMDMFPRSRLGRIHDPFTAFGGGSHFGFPQFNSLGRRRANTEQDDDFFHRMPTEFRQYMPDSFGHRHTPNTGMHPQGTHPGTPGGPMGPLAAQAQYYTGMPQSPTKKVCDAAIQTEDPAEHSEVDHTIPIENLNQQGLRNTVDMGVKSEREMHGTRSHSAPPNEQQMPTNDKHNSTSTPTRSFTPPKQHTSFHQQSHRPTPLNTHQQQPPPQQSQNLPPQTPHTMDSINKIQNIQRDVLELMSHVEKFSGTRGDKEYVYLDEMLTRNLLKLDNIDTNGKDSIRLARKEAIKCIQASINVLEAKAEENIKNCPSKKSISATNINDFNAVSQPQKSASGEEITKETITSTNEATKDSANEQKPADATKIQEPIPLPPPEGMISMENESQQLAAKVVKDEENEKLGKVIEESKSQKEASPTATGAKCDDATETK
uniref:BAG domain-containing protein n=1 Tax=Glossina brevipalpis TaxID=37001 RepID=A0A1A9WN56_9MUSC